MNSTAEGNEFVHFDEYEDAVVAIAGGPRDGTGSVYLIRRFRSLHS
ncbi:MAG TPA: hypothetical protein VK148_18850 [Xanthobacteraceae bacterium]|jgi:hypothetical protein|nr:hypothetical protein [Xanthobacteraceae bacterium]